MDLPETFLQTCKEIAQPFVDDLMLKGLLATAGMFAGFLFGVEFLPFVGVLIILVLLDTITGVWGAKLNGETISSKRFIASVPKLIRYLIFIAAGHLLQLTIPFEMYIENVVLVFLAATEFISIMENLGKSGMPVPKKLLNQIEQLRDKQ